MYKKFVTVLFLSALAFAFFVPVIVLAEPYMSPEFNPLCWEKDDCANAREQSGVSGEKYAKSGWLEKEAPCLKDGWGKCLAGRTTVAEVSFGGNSEFRDIGVYIKTVYNYSLVVIGILGVVVIIIAGIQWTTSAGNAETIGKSKKRITGAVIGLIIAYMSYNILNTINPATVNLRLPQIYMIRSSNIAPVYCKDFEDKNIGLAYAGSSEDDVKAPEQIEPKYTVAEAETLSCNSKYFFSSGGGMTCEGAHCENGSCVLDWEDDKNTGRRRCIGGSIAGTISGMPEISCPVAIFAGAEGWAFPWVEDGGDMDLVAVCKINSYYEGAEGSSGSVGGRKWVENANVTIYSMGSRNQVYAVKVNNNDIDKAVAWCESQGGIKGFILFIAFDENCDPSQEEHYIGRGGVDLGDNEYEGTHYYLSSLDDSYFISADEIKKGNVNIDISVDSVSDIDETEDIDVYKSIWRKVD